MTHKAETITLDVLSTVTGLTTTTTRVERNRVYEIAAAGLPALSINMGADDVVEGSGNNMAFIDRLLTINIDAYVKTNSTLDIELNKIRAEVWAALMADRQQGALVIDTLPAGDEAPEIDQLEKGVARQRMVWQFHYRHSITNPEA